MSNYTSDLKSWGDVGVAYPDGYSHLAGEPPVDGWENFFKHNVIGDLDSLINITNNRIETDKGTSANKPSTPEASHLFYATDIESFEYWDSTESSWHRLLAADGDSLEGALDFAGNSAHNVGPMNMAGDLDLASNSLLDGTATLWDSTNQFIPQTNLENDSLTITAGSGLSGGGSVSLGSSVTLDVSGGSGSGLDADTVDGFHAEDLGVNVEEKGTLQVSSSTGINFTEHLNVIDDGDGTVTIDPSHTHDYVSLSGDTMSGDLDMGGNSLVNAGKVTATHVETRTSAPSSPESGQMWIIE